MNPVAPVIRQTSSRSGSIGLPRNGVSPAPATSARPAASVAVAMSRTTPQFLLAAPWQSASTASSALRKLLRLGLRQRQRRQQLDHVVLAGGHRDHPVVAVQRDHDQLWEQPLARHVDQPPVQPRDARARRAQLDPDHQPAAAHLLDHLVALLELGEPVEQHPAHARGVLDQAVALDDAQCGQTGCHGQPVATEVD